MNNTAMTAFSNRFRGDSFELRPEIEGRDGATLWLSFYPGEGVNFAAYDYKLNCYSHEFKAGAEALEGFISELEQSFDVEIPSHFKEDVELFLGHNSSAFGVDVQLEKNVESCDVCGDYTGNELEAFYFPAFEPGGEASLAVKNNFGCFGGDEIYGDPDEIAEEAITIIESAISRATPGPEAEAAKDFLVELKATLGLD